MMERAALLMWRTDWAQEGRQGTRKELLRQGRGRSVQERANEFEGWQVTKGDSAKHWGRRNWMRLRAGDLLREGGPGSLPTRRRRRCGQERGQCRGW